jgi:hypothetical protein
MWYDGNKTLTHNCLFNFVLSNRGFGKTYWFKKWAIKDFIKNGNQFIYLRRYKQELKKISKFFDDIRQEFPDHKLEVKGMNFLIDGQIAGGAHPLSTAVINKSVPFPKVDKIGFDEFIIDKGTYHYLPDEVLAFLEFYETIGRLREFTDGTVVKVFFLANAITFVNPYFMFFDLKMPYGKTIFKKGDKLLEVGTDEEFIQAKKNTRFGKLITGTPYGDYAIENKFLRDNDTFIERKAGTAQYYFTFKFKGNLYGVWLDWQLGKIWVSENIDPCCKLIFTISLEDHSPNTLLIKRLSGAGLFKTFIQAYKQGCVYFESQKIKTVVYEVIRLTMI